MRPLVPRLAVILLAAGVPVAGAAQPVPVNDGAAIEKAIHASIGWALTKDRALLQSVLSHDAGLFIFHPDSKSTVVGWEPMERLFAVWMDPRFKATRYEISLLSQVLIHLPYPAIALRNRAPVSALEGLLR